MEEILERRWRYTNVSYFLDLLLIKIDEQQRQRSLGIRLAMTMTMFRNTDITLGIL